MRHIALFLATTLIVGCSNLTDEQQAVLGAWQWERDGLTGYIVLNRDKTFTYEYSWETKTEKLTESFPQPHLSAQWSLEGNTICLNSPGKNNMKCYWSFEVDHLGNIKVFYIIEGTSGKKMNNPIEARKVNDVT